MGTVRRDDEFSLIIRPDVETPSSNLYAKLAFTRYIGDCFFWLSRGRFAPAHRYRYSELGRDGVRSVRQSDGWRRKCTCTLYGMWIRGRERSKKKKKIPPTAIRESSGRFYICDAFTTLLRSAEFSNPIFFPSFDILSLVFAVRDLGVWFLYFFPGLGNFVIYVCGLPASHGWSSEPVVTKVSCRYVWKRSRRAAMLIKTRATFVFAVVVAARTRTHRRSRYERALVYRCLVETRFAYRFYARSPALLRGAFAFFVFIKYDTRVLRSWLTPASVFSDRRGFLFRSFWIELFAVISFSSDWICTLSIYWLWSEVKYVFEILLPVSCYSSEVISNRY